MGFRLASFKCPRCGSTFERTALSGHGVLGLSGLAFGLFAVTVPLWPFVLRVYAKCPICSERSWIKVLRPRKMVQVAGFQKPY